MSVIDLKQNFSRILRTLEGKGMKPTSIAKSIGYTTTSQLNSTIAGDSLLSTKAIIGLIDNLNVNPAFLFLGKGEMFLTDESDVDKLKKENTECIQRHNEAVNVIMTQHQMIQTLEKRNFDLIEITSSALKYHKEKKDEEPTSGDVNPEDIIAKYKNMNDLTSWSSVEIEKHKFDSSLKREKK